MSVSGNAESGPISGHPQVQPQQFVHVAKAVPIKKRKFPVIQPVSPTSEEMPKNKQESNIPDEGLLVTDSNKNTASPCNFNANKTLPFILRKEVIPSTNIDLGQGNVEVLASNLLGARPSVGSSVMNSLRDEMSTFSNAKSLEKGVRESYRSTVMKNVKQEVFVREKVGGTSRAPISTRPMNNELSLGLKEPPKLQKVDPSSLIYLRQTGERFVLCDNNGSTVDNVNSEVRAGRLHWDLNTNMDAWEPHTNHDTSALRIVELGKASRCNSGVSCLTTAGTLILGLGRGKHILDDHRCSSANSVVLPHCSADDSHDLGLAVPFNKRDGNTKCPSLIHKSASTDGSLRLNLKQVHPSAVNMSKAVNSEPAYGNSNNDCSIDSCGSSDMGSSKLVSGKRELVNSIALEMAFPLSSDNRVVGHQSIKTEMVEGTREASRSDDVILTPTVSRVMQHQVSCVSSSALQMPLPSQGSSGLPISSELTMTGNLSSQSQHSFHCKEFHNSIDNHDVRQDDTNGNLGNVGNSNLEDHDKSKVPSIDEHAFEACQSGEIAADNDKKINVPTEEDSFGSNCESQENCAIETPETSGEIVSGKENEDYGDGEVQEHLQRSAGKDIIMEGKKTLNFETVDSVPPHDQNTYGSDFQETVTTNKNLDVSLSNSEDNTLQKVSDRELQVTVNERRSTLGEEDVAKHVSCKDNGQADYLSPFRAEKSLDEHQATKDLGGNKSRVINLSDTSVATRPGKTRPILNRLPASRSGRQIYSDLDGEFQPQVNRDGTCIGRYNKFAKDRVQDHLQRNPRPSFMPGKGRISRRFGPIHNDRDSDHEFTRQSSYLAGRRRHASNISDAELECNSHGIPQGGAALGNCRRKTITDEFPTSYSRRLSPGDRDGGVTRSIPMLHRVHSNMNQNDWDSDKGFIGFQHGGKFMPHLSDDIIEYDNLDCQLVQGNRNFPTLKGHHSKSPARSRKRSPGPWKFHGRSPTFYQAGRIISPDSAYFCDEIVTKRREPPSYTARHPNALQGVDSRQEHVHPRSNKRSSTSHVFPRITRRAEALDTRETAYSEEYTDVRRKFIHRRLPPCSLHPNYRGENVCFRFDQNKGPRPYRFSPEMETEFNVSKREFNGRIKNSHPMGGRRRVRNLEEQVEQVWQDDGFSDGLRVKSRRY